MTKAKAKAVRRTADFQYYQVLHYDTWIELMYAERYIDAIRLADQANVPRPKPITIRQQVVKEHWDRESAAEKKLVHELAEADFQRRKREAEAPPQVPQTPSDYDR